MNKEFLTALEEMSKEKGLDKELLIEAIETALITACKKNFGNSDNIVVNVNRDNGEISVFAQKTVVEEVEDSTLEVSLDEAKAIDPNYNLGEVVNFEVTPRNFGRIAAQTAKQVVVQRVREAEREIIFNEYISKEKDVVTGIIQRQEKGNVYVNVGKTEGLLIPAEQMKNEEYKTNQRIKVYINEVIQNNKGPQIYVSRSHPELVKRLFEQEVPEIFDGVVEIKSVSREGGSRTKMAVHSNDPDVDPIGACVGANGNRVNVIVDELKGEKIDIILWDEDPKKYIAAALSPSKVVSVEVDEENKSAKVIVPDYQLSLAIGKDGQNARLAARLTGWKIDIKSEAQEKGE
ncbi:MAG: transcription termination factor NusA [Clostridia bacterium]|nr:transcription termination factor NusA [Clostridia bacterium]